MHGPTWIFWANLTPFSLKLHSMEPPLKLGCYTSPRSWNGMCGPPGEAATGFGYEAVDMNFFAEIGCDHVMVDEPDGEPSAFRSRYKLLGDAIADSSNPNMVFGVWCSPTHPWKWAAEVGGNYWRLAGDIYDSWSAVLRQWDVIRASCGVRPLLVSGSMT